MITVDRHCVDAKTVCEKQVENSNKSSNLTDPGFNLFKKSIHTKKRYRYIKIIWSI